MTSAATTPPTIDPAPQQPASRTQLQRSTSDRMVGGVCGGLAEYSGVDALLWRVGFVGLTVAGGAGVLVYLLLWVLMPSAPAAADFVPSPLDRQVQRLHERMTRRSTTG
ncbi:PspC domain-containing protein [Blastococcus sp. SYSU D00669]